MEEIWKPIPGYEGIYFASNFGRIKSFARTKERILNPSNNTKGYPHVKLWKNQKYRIFRVHRLIMLTFVGESDLGVNHLDGVKTNNRIDNLEYCSNRDNIDHAILLGLRNTKHYSVVL